MCAPWFAELCESNTLEPIEPITARDITTDIVMFTVTGTPRQIVRVSHRTSGSVRVDYADGWRDIFPPDARLSLVARRAECA